MQTIQIHLSEKEKIFSELFFPFFKPTSNFAEFESKMTLIAYVLLKSQTQKNVLR